MSKIYTCVEYKQAGGVCRKPAVYANIGYAGDISPSCKRHSLAIRLGKDAVLMTTVEQAYEYQSEQRRIREEQVRAEREEKQRIAHEQYLAKENEKSLVRWQTVSWQGNAMFNEEHVTYFGMDDADGKHKRHWAEVRVFVDRDGFVRVYCPNVNDMLVNEAGAWAEVLSAAVAHAISMQRALIVEKNVADLTPSHA